MPLPLVLQRDSWLLLYKDQTSTWLSSCSHVTQKIYCNIFKHCFCSGVCTSVWLQWRPSSVQCFLFILGLSKLEWLHMIVIIVFIPLLLLFFFPFHNYWQPSGVLFESLYEISQWISAHLSGLNWWAVACKLLVCSHCCTRMQTGSSLLILLN